MRVSEEYGFFHDALSVNSRPPSTATPVPPATSAASNSRYSFLLERSCLPTPPPAQPLQSPPWAPSPVSVCSSTSYSLPAQAPPPPPRDQYAVGSVSSSASTPVVSSVRPAHTLPSLDALPGGFRQSNESSQWRKSTSFSTPFGPYPPPIYEVKPPPTSGRPLPNPFHSPGGDVSALPNGNASSIPSCSLPPVETVPWKVMLDTMKQGELAHRASVEQQREILRYVRTLHKWLDSNVQELQFELINLSDSVKQLRREILLQKSSAVPSPSAMPTLHVPGGAPPLPSAPPGYPVNMQSPPQARFPPGFMPTVFTPSPPFPPVIPPFPEASIPNFGSFAHGRDAGMAHPDLTIRALSAAPPLPNRPAPPSPGPIPMVMPVGCFWPPQPSSPYPPPFIPAVTPTPPPSNWRGRLSPNPIPTLHSPAPSTASIIIPPPSTASNSSYSNTNSPVVVPAPGSPGSVFHPSYLSCISERTEQTPSAGSSNVSPPSVTVREQELRGRSRTRTSVAMTPTPTNSRTASRSRSRPRRGHRISPSPVRMGAVSRSPSRRSPCRRYSPSPSPRRRDRSYGHYERRRSRSRTPIRVSVNPTIIVCNAGAQGCNHTERHSTSIPTIVRPAYRSRSPLSVVRGRSPVYRASSIPSRRSESRSRSRIPTQPPIIIAGRSRSRSRNRTPVRVPTPCEHTDRSRSYSPSLVCSEPSIVCRGPSPPRLVPLIRRCGSRSRSRSRSPRYTPLPPQSSTVVTERSPARSFTISPPYTRSPSRSPVGVYLPCGFAGSVMPPLASPPLPPVLSPPLPPMLSPPLPPMFSSFSPMTPQTSDSFFDSPQHSPYYIPTPTSLGQVPPHLPRSAVIYESPVQVDDLLAPMNPSPVPTLLSTPPSQNNPTRTALPLHSAASSIPCRPVVVTVGPSQIPSIPSLSSNCGSTLVDCTPPSSESANPPWWFSTPSTSPDRKSTSSPCCGGIGDIHLAHSRPQPVPPPVARVPEVQTLGTPSSSLRPSYSFPPRVVDMPPVRISTTPSSTPRAGRSFMNGSDRPDHGPLPNLGPMHNLSLSMAKPTAWSSWLTDIMGDSEQRTIDPRQIALPNTSVTNSSASGSRNSCIW